jgi:hypothetical protein
MAQLLGTKGIGAAAMGWINAEIIFAANTSRFAAASEQAVRDNCQAVLARFP